MKIEITPLNYSGQISVVTELDGSTTNAFGSYFPDEKIKHYYLCQINDNFEPQSFMKVKTRDRGQAIGFLTFVEVGVKNFRRIKKVIGEKLTEEIKLSVKKGKSVEFVKYITVADSRDYPEDKLRFVLEPVLTRACKKGFDTLLRENNAAWEKAWQQADVCVQTAGDNDKLNSQIRFNIYQLLTNGSEKRADHGIGIKGFTGEMYRGHYFWDTEMYMFPFFLYNFPKIARNLLIFRHSTLPKARENARNRGYKGSLFVWESDNLGNEGINPDINRETGFKRRRETLDQLHINLDVFYALFSYFRATEDTEFMIKYGAEMLIENLRFWTSFLKYNSKIGRYETINIMGPDEYHANLNNNYYTNYLLGFIIRQSLAFLNVLRTKRPAVCKNITKKLKVAPAELTKWNDLNGKIYLPAPKDGVLEQFSGYFNLRDYKIDRYNEFGIPIINELEHLKDPSHPKYTPTLTHYHEALVKFARTATLIKQADTILLFNLFPHEFSEDTKRKTLAYYEPRTLHYSSLSPGVYALAAARLGMDKLAAKHWHLSLIMDLEDVKHESAKALHTPTSGEVYSILTAGFAGLSPNGDALELDPHLPKGWKSIKFNYTWKGCNLSFTVTPKQVTVKSTGRRTITLFIKGNKNIIKPNKNYKLSVR
jgi:kojibiose phosphorylase